MNHYEAVFILTPVLSDAQMKEAVDKFKNLLTEQGAEIVNEENWGLRKLAYPIDKKTTGFYTFLEFNAEPVVIDKLEINFRRDERVIRFLTVKQDKFALEYAEKRRNKGAKKHEEKVEEPAPAPKPIPTPAPVQEVVTEPAVETVESEKKED
jgi:small subunit ribosomal protein S6